jgi:hypothetical protein
MPNAQLMPARAARGRVGLGAQLGYGVNVSADGSVHWDDGVVYGQLPSGMQSGARKLVADCAGGCDLDKIYHDSLHAAALAIGTVGFPLGLVASGLIELVNAYAPPRATIDWSWESQFGSYNPGAPGSLWEAGNSALRGTYDAWVASGKGGSLNQVYAMLASQFAAFLKAWNGSHSGPAKDWTIAGTNRPGWGNRWGNQPADSSPLAVAANFLAVQAGAPSPTTFHFSANAGSALAQSSFNGAVVTKQGAETTSTSTGTKVVTGVAVAVAVAAGGVGVWAWLTHQAYTAAWKRLYKEAVDRVSGKGKKGKRR